MARKASKDRKYRLGVYLFKDGCVDFDEALNLKNSFVPKMYSIKGFSEDVMALFVKSPVAALPRWATLFEGILEEKLENLINSSSSAVLLLKHENRIFAFTFGYGRSLINLSLVEENFGLKVALNSVDADKIRSVNIKNLDTVVRQSTVQTSQAGSVDTFGLNLDRDILNGVTGLSNDPVLGERISGSVALHLSLSIKANGLTALCSKLIEKFNSKTYRERFSWVDHIADIKNISLINELNGLLIKAIQGKDFERLYLAIPDIIDWQRVKGFKYKDSDELVREDIHIIDVLPPDEKLKEKVSVDWLKRKSVLAVDTESEQIIDGWPLYRCINYEVRKDDKDSSTYLLTAGKWFKIDTDYVKTVSRGITKIPEYNKFQFPEHEGEMEGDYNKRVSDSDKTRCVLMDMKNINYGGGHSKVEFCDLYIDKTDFVHVKRFRGSPALSHLFLQGLNSAFLLLTDPGFLKGVNNELPQSWRFSESSQIRASDYEVVFAIISKVKKGVQDILPFFSKVSLLQVYKQLKAYGYNISIAKISAKEKYGES